MKINRSTNYRKRQLRVRENLMGTSVRPRLSVERTNQHVFAQLIDDTAHKTLAGLSTKNLKGSKAEKALELGKLIAGKALEMKIDNIIFDRGAFRYHGRVKAVADGAREAGLKF
jgi:large subunit ribosomal protein L18